MQVYPDPQLSVADESLVQYLSDGSEFSSQKSGIQGQVSGFVMIMSMIYAFLYVCLFSCGILMII